jgi:hypothetical protein
MKWSVGKELYYRDVIESNVTSSILPHTYGTIEKIEEGVFGGTRPLQYVDLQDLRIIHGIFCMGRNILYFPEVPLLMGELR